MIRHNPHSIRASDRTQWGEREWILIVKYLVVKPFKVVLKQRLKAYEGGRTKYHNKLRFAYYLWSPDNEEHIDERRASLVFALNLELP